ncbi:hypothetical protein T07_11089 [Trichinella nelsoni]|uniref:Uncharacterized protein n=1 Tax=Trichinella nelsoni TaxID=6336 RepID=A0A0V0RNT7_9BILA|nr:hypothetical protein T07_4949 [Trichinella nelsoni]KRX16123.1 hypothetical protein T07_11089 [Trichinella nelsoni]
MSVGLSNTSSSNSSAATFTSTATTDDTTTTATTIPLPLGMLALLFIGTIESKKKLKIHHQQQFWTLHIRNSAESCRIVMVAAKIVWIVFIFRTFPQSGSRTFGT